MGLREAVKESRVKHDREEIVRLLNILVPWVLQAAKVFNRAVLPEGKVQQLIYMSLSTKVSNFYSWEVSEVLQYYLERMSIFYRVSEGIVVMPVLVQAILQGKDLPAPPASKRAAEKIADELKKHGVFQQYGGRWEYDKNTGRLKITIEPPE